MIDLTVHTAALARKISLLRLGNSGERSMDFCITHLNLKISNLHLIHCLGAAMMKIIFLLRVPFARAMSRARVLPRRPMGRLLIFCQRRAQRNFAMNFAPCDM